MQVTWWLYDARLVGGWQPIDGETLEYALNKPKGVINDLKMHVTGRGSVRTSLTGCKVTGSTAIKMMDIMACLD